MSNKETGLCIKNSNTPYADYNQFAWLYNQEWGFFGSQVFFTINKIVGGTLPSGAKILDLCCGTGQLAKILSERGYRVTGLDGSAEMLKLARNNAPQAEFILEDARTFQLPPVFDAVFSTFDSLNHLMGSKEMKAAFRHVFNCLITGGIFLFDLNTEKAYGTQWKGYLDVIEKPDYLYINRADYDVKKRVGQTHCTLFRRQGESWQRSEIRLYQKYHPVTKVESLLQKAGFHQIRKLAVGSNRGLHKFTEDDPRVFIACRKPGKSAATPCSGLIGHK